MKDRLEKHYEETYEDQRLNRWERHLPMPADIVAYHVARTADQMPKCTGKRTPLNIEGLQEAAANGAPTYLLIDILRLRTARAIIALKLLSAVQADVLFVCQRRILYRIMLPPAELLPLSFQTNHGFVL